MYFRKEINLNHFWESAGVDIANSPNGGKYSGYPPGAAFLTLPFFIVEQVIAFLIIKVFGYLNGNIAWIMESWFLALPSILAASFSSILIYSLLNRFKVDKKISYFTSWAFFFAAYLPAYTSVIHYNNLSMFFAALALWLILIPIQKPEGLIKEPFRLGKTFLTGLSLGLAGMTEYVTALFVFPILIFLLTTKRTRWEILFYLLGFGIPISLLLCYNTVSFGGPLQFSHFFVGEQAKKGLVFGFNLHQGLFGLYLSPLRGLIFYAPLVLTSLFGIKEFYKKYKKEFSVFILYILIPSLVYGFWREWWGGWNYGPRFLLSTLPAWFIFAGFGLNNTLKGPAYPKRPGLTAVVFIGFLTVFGYFSGFIASLNGIRSKVQVPTNTFHFTFIEKLQNLSKGLIQADTDRFTSMLIRLKEDTPILANINTRILIYVYLFLILVISMAPLLYLFKNKKID